MDFPVKAIPIAILGAANFNYTNFQKPDAPQQSDAPVWPRGMASTNIPKVRPRFIRQKSFEGATAGQSAIIVSISPILYPITLQFL